MAYFRYVVEHGEYVLRGTDPWHITFNGVQIGGACRGPHEALAMIAKSRNGELVGPSLAGVADPDADLAVWQSTGAQLTSAPDLGMNSPPKVLTADD